MQDHGLEQIVKSLLSNVTFAKYLPGSGSIHANEDVITPKWLIQCKDTISKSYNIKLTDIERLVINAEKMKLIPIFIVRIMANDRAKENSFVYRIEPIICHKSIRARKDTLLLEAISYRLHYLCGLFNLQDYYKEEVL